jgi:hypothetical protein
MENLEYYLAILFVFIATVTPVLLLSLIADYITKRLKNKENEKN